MVKTFLIVICFCGMFLFTNKINAENDEFVIVEAHNVFSIKAKIEIKCNFNNLTGKYAYWEMITLPPNNYSNLKFSKKLTHCEIWPHIKIFGGD